MKCLHDGSFELPNGVFWSRVIPPGKLNEKEILAGQILADQLLKFTAEPFSQTLEK